MTAKQEHHWLSKIVEVFLRGNLSILFIVITLIAGAVALMVTPREEEPQIVVPLADVLVQMPGASAEEVEQQVSSRLERLLYQIDGVEYVYSMSRPGMAIVTVRFYVGENREASLVKLYNKISMHTDAVPAGVTGWVVKPIEIDDVPVLFATLWSREHDAYTLRRLAEQVEIRLQGVNNTARTEVVGGLRRQLRIDLDPEALASRKLMPLDIAHTLNGANVNVPAGAFSRDNRQWLVESGPYLRSGQEFERLVVGVYDGNPVYLRDVATVHDGPEEPAVYTRIGFGPGAQHAHAGKPDAHAAQPGETATAAHSGGDDYPAVTVAVAKRHGTNAVWVARDLEAKLDELRRDFLPAGVEMLVTRNYGESANDKVNELVEHLGLAIIIVVGLIGFALGWREALIVVTAVPLTFALTLLINYLAGYSINRVTLFALILSLGLVVDDPIVDVENVFRHFRLRKEPPLKAVLTAVNEVRPPIIVATLVVILSFLPMFFITGMMGPYMRPMALNVPVAMLMSMVVAFTVTPWMSYHVLKGEYGHGGHDEATGETLTHRIYRAVVNPFLNSRIAAWLLIVVMVALFAVSAALPAVGVVPVKMLPFDNKNEFQIVVDLPDGSTLEATDEVLRALGDHLQTVPEVTNYLTFAGTASPIDFNGMVRHYYFRQSPHLGDIRVNLLKKHSRQQQSHAILLRLRNELDAIGQRYGARLKLVEAPPGPPVYATLVAEVYGDADRSYGDLQAAAIELQARFKAQPGVVDVDDTVEDDQAKFVFVVDKEKAALHGLTAATLASTVRLAIEGRTPGEDTPLTINAGSGRLHRPRELNSVPIVLQLPRARRSALADIERLSLRTSSGAMVQLTEFGHFEETTADKTIYHKNLQRVVYVQGDVAGRSPPEAILALQADVTQKPLPEGIRVVWNGEGEWKITLDVFRDLGLAFGGAILAIYVLLVWQTGSYSLPLVRMISIPLTIIGIMPGFWLLNVFGAANVGGYQNSIYFTATAMIGMVALAGIADRNAILLIDFIQTVLERGGTLREALIESGAVRFRPIVLTAGASMLGAWPITLDPVFSGLAWALIFGLIVSTAFTLILVPVVYWMLYEKAPGHGLPQTQLDDEPALAAH